MSGSEIGAQGVADRALHRVGALVGILRDGIVGIVDHIGVVAGCSDHRIGPQAAVQGIVAVQTIERVEAIAVPIKLPAERPARRPRPSSLRERSCPRSAEGIGRLPHLLIGHTFEIFKNY